MQIGSQLNLIALLFLNYALTLCIPSCNQAVTQAQVEADSEAQAVAGRLEWRCGALKTSGANP